MVINMFLQINNWGSDFSSAVYVELVYRICNCIVPQFAAITTTFKASILVISNIYLIEILMKNSFHELHNILI